MNCILVRQRKRKWYNITNNNATLVQFSSLCFHPVSVMVKAAIWLPGRYLCDYTYYTSLHLGKGCAAFIHVPPIGRPYSSQDLGRALQAAVLEMLQLLETNHERDDWWLLHPMGGVWRKTEAPLRLLFMGSSMWFPRLSLITICQGQDVTLVLLIVKFTSRLKILYKIEKKKNNCTSI